LLLRLLGIPVPVDRSRCCSRSHCLILWRYFAFPVPMVFDTLIALGLIVVAIVAP
jgi:hypothetical protein